MKKELEDRLVARFPGFFAGTHLSPRESSMCFGCEVKDGWYSIIDDTCELLEYIKAPIMWTQIKEKFGGLRMYYRFTEGNIPNLMPDAVNVIISAAEERASYTCESCGDHHTASIRCNYGWARCECDDCYAKRTTKPTGG